jgi:hypothetical protein
VCLLILAACGQTDLAQANEPVATDSYRYVLDGATSSAADVTALSEAGVTLFYFVEWGEPLATAYVFTNQADFVAHDQKTQTFQPESLCISTRTVTTVYDHTSYGGDEWDMVKGVSYPDLGLFLQNFPDSPGETWLNDISSIKMADCVYTTLYEDPNYSLAGNVFKAKGNNYSTMPAGFNNTVSSIKVGS